MISRFSECFPAPIHLNIDSLPVDYTLLKLDRVEMVKRGAKPKNRNFNDEDRGSEVRTRSITPNHDEADEVFARHQQFHSSVIRDGFSSTLMPTKSYDRTHSPFFLHSADHSGLSIVSHTLDGTNYNS